jgi:hypothetical protein
VALASPRHARLLVALGVLAAVGLGAAPAATIRVDTWGAHPAGRLNLASEWRRYPDGGSPFKEPPTIVMEDGRRVLQLVTIGEAMRVGRTLKIDLAKTPWLVWEWKPLTLPDGGDVRDPKRNDQAGRVMVFFEGMKGLLYVWDTTAPVGAEARSDELELFQRVLIVVRSGSKGLGHWSRERRNVYKDYRRLFEEEPRAIKMVGVESHSNDTNTRASMRFGRVHFESR